MGCDLAQVETERCIERKLRRSRRLPGGNRQSGDLLTIRIELTGVESQAPTALMYDRLTEEGLPLSKTTILLLMGSQEHLNCAPLAAGPTNRPNLCCTNGWT